MRRVDSVHRLDSFGGVGTAGARVARSAAAVRAAAALLLPLSALLCAACQTASPQSRAAAAAAYRANVDSGLSLYESGEFPLAAQRFRTAAERAYVMSDRTAEKNAVAAECASWLRARNLSQLSLCSQRLEVLQRRTRRSEPGVNTLIAFGAIAGHRPLPPLRIPTAVRPLVRASAGEEGR